MLTRQTAVSWVFSPWLAAALWPWRRLVMADSGRIGQPPIWTEAWWTLAVVGRGHCQRGGWQATALIGSGYYVAVPGKSGGCYRRQPQWSADMTGATIMNG